MPITTAVVADDEILNRELMAELLPRLGIAVRTVKDGVQALKALEAEPAELLITDIRMPGMGGLKLLLKAKEKWPEMPVVMMTAFASVESAVESMRQGAYDYLMKPFGIEHVESLLIRLNERAGLVREVRRLRDEVRDRHRGRVLLGDSPAMAAALDTVSKAARSNATVLVHGESGTGKELVARALHEQSPRANGPFVRVNCAALTETLLTSELFGHEKGSFTGASQQHQGWFERADRGTLFLDEIGELPLPAQVRLLRVLQDHQIERVGGRSPLHVDVRIVAATHRDLSAMVKERTFREDLWYRVNVFPILLPTLRERLEDIPALVRHFARRAATRFGLPYVEPTAANLAVLSAYAWPGNIRELGAVIDRAAILGGGRSLAVDVALGLGRQPAVPPPPPDEATLYEVIPESSFEPTPAAEPPSATRDILPLETAMRQHIERALAATRGRIEGQRGAAAILDINPHTLRARMRKLGIDPSRYRE